MPKKKKGNKNTSQKQTRPLPIADLGQTYGLVSASLGDRRMRIECQDGTERIGRIRGKIRKRRSSWINAGRYVIVAFREYQDEKCDIIELLSEDEVKRLKKLNEIVDQTHEEDEDNGIEFEMREETVEVNIDEI
jgi:translation initiation factor 1A